MSHLADLLNRNFTNKEVTISNQMSGNWYVSLIDRGDNKLGRVVRVSPEKCGHTNRICALCAYSWGWDHQLRLETTGGGRKLLEEMEALGLDVDAIRQGKGTKPNV